MMDARTAARELETDRRLNATNPVRPGSPLRMRVSPKAYMNAIATEGVEVQTAAADGYWKDMRKRYPHIDLQPDKGADRGHGGNRLGWGRRYEQAEYWRTKTRRSARRAAA